MIQTFIEQAPWESVKVGDLVYAVRLRVHRNGQEVSWVSLQTLKPTALVNGKIVAGTRISYENEGTWRVLSVDYLGDSVYVKAERIDPYKPSTNHDPWIVHDMDNRLDNREKQAEADILAVSQSQLYPYFPEEEPNTTNLFGFKLLDSDKLKRVIKGE